MPSPTADHQQLAAIRKVTFGSAFGTALEFYDFLIYGTAAALVFGTVFYPGSSPLAAGLASFATFAVGFAARPLGGLLFSHLGDRVGRKPILLITLLMMGLGTVGIGLLPGYDAIGIWAPILLVVLRVVQGVALGGEVGGGQLVVYENAPRGTKAFFTAIVQGASSAGSAVSGGLLLIFSASLTPEAFLAWGWRVPFLLSIVVVLIGVYIRRRVSESPAFERVKKEGTTHRVPAGALFKRQPGSLIFAVLLLGTGISYYINTVYSVSYVRAIGMPVTTTLLVLLIMNLAVLPLFPLVGRLAERIGKTKVLVAGIVLSIAVMLFYFPVIGTGDPVLYFVAMLVTSIAFQTFNAIQPTFVADLFDIRIRFSAMAISNSIGTVVFGGLAPFVATALLAAGGGAPWPIAIYAIAGQLLALLGIVGMLGLARRRARRESRDVAPIRPAGDTDIAA
ncbi:MHS family MFS transporter [Cnuibacter physcomitrellae]|uniref:MFS transporter n=1 Tax=Cnuibacter physcomitrellae TaxID=1619308 RepID=UPI002175EC1F|nr:MFS transporter [Cnuibacter physcomitrellae]MCS5498305.1 MHS family MFS transporter [Cnuibacter physcomitrellae]